MVEKEQMENVEIVCNDYKKTLSASDLKKIMGKVQPLLNQIKNEYMAKEDWSNDRIEIKTRKILLVPSGPVANTSGIPHPSPCIGFPLADHPSAILPDQEIKIKKHGATLTATRFNGCLCNIEIKIKRTSYLSSKEDFKIDKKDKH